LKLDLGRGPQAIPDAFNTLAGRENITKERIWHLLRLFCLHAAEHSIDIDKTDDYKVLVRQKLTVQAFQQLPDDIILYPSKLLLRVNQDFNFLNGASRESILNHQAEYEQRNFNVLLFITLLQVKSADADQQEQARERAESMLEELKRKCVASRQQPERGHICEDCPLPF
jgi:hypothetical protein